MNKNSNEITPQARSKGLVVQKLTDEVVVYDTESQKAHCLNPSAALVWEHCDGKKTVTELSNLLLKGDSKEREEMVWVALDQLEKSNLLERSIAKPSAVNGLNRRQMLKAAGIAAMIAVPVVSTIVAPKAAQASTCVASGGSCTISAQCCSGLCSGVTCA